MTVQGKGVYPNPPSDVTGQFPGWLLPEVYPFQGPGILALGVGLADREARGSSDLLPDGVGWAEQDLSWREPSGRQGLAQAAGLRRGSGGSGGLRDGSRRARPWGFPPGDLWSCAGRVRLPRRGVQGDTAARGQHQQLRPHGGSVRPGQVSGRGPSALVLTSCPRRRPPPRHGSLLSLALAPPRPAGRQRRGAVLKP